MYILRVPWKKNQRECAATEGLIIEAETSEYIF